MILEIIIGILGFSVVVLGFTTFNLLNKNEKAEDIIVSYQEFINNLSEEINKSDKRLEQIDQRGIFKSDDEIGWFFNEVKKIKKNLAKFKVDL
jgi:competence protein ComGF|tara:strand:+ start:345 stop:623 length:279 start_codon:yes stop_codon:yes gene_type:complete